MVELIKIVILGIIEGMTEFLPISSTGHLIVATALLNPDMSGSTRNTFDIFIQLGAVVAVVIFFRADIVERVRTLPTSAESRRFGLALFIAFIPAAVVGLIFRDTIKDVLFNPTVVAVALIIGGIALIGVEFLPGIRGRSGGEVDFSSVSLPRALLIGAMQTLALIPGASRAASTIIGGMVGGLNRETATAFSFYLAIPTLGLATIAELVFSLDELHISDLPYLLIGAIVSGIFAWISIRWLLRYVASHTYIPFGLYRIAAGVLILLLISAQIIPT